MKQRERNGGGENRSAIDALAGEIEERYGAISVADRPLIERARTLATAVDLDPGNSQLQIQLGAALTQLRREVLEAGRDRYETVMWQLRTGCEIHDRGAVHCASCCGAIPTISEMQSWDPPWRSSFMEDAEYGRLAVIEYLGARHRVRYGE